MNYNKYFYILYFIFLSTFRYPELAGLYVLITSILLLSYYPKQTVQSFRKLVILILLVVIPNFILIPILGVYWRAIAFLIYFAFLVISFENIKPNVVHYVKFVNVTYVVYVILSYLVYFDIINAGLRLTDIRNQFDEIYFDCNLKTMIGFEGSTAGMDAYSMLVMIINLAYFKVRKEAIYLIGLSLTNIIWTTRLTPWAMIIVPIIYLIIPSSIQKTKKLVILTIMFFSFLIPKLLSELLEIDIAIFNLITHGRADIWFEYSELLMKSSLNNILFGFRNSELPYVSVWGASYFENQPHSSYLRMLLANGLIIYLFFIYIFYYKYKNIENKKAIFVTLSIMTAAITNVNVFYNDNPIYLITFFVFTQTNLDE